MLSHGLDERQMTMEVPWSALECTMASRVTQKGVMHGRRMEAEGELTAYATGGYKVPCM
jgi:hypothetical protein